MTSVPFSEEKPVRLIHEMHKKNVRSVAFCLLMALISPSEERESHVGHHVGHGKRLAGVWMRAFSVVSSVRRV